MASEAEVSVTVAHAFGSACGQSELNNSVVFADEAGQHLAFAVGRHVGIRHIESGEMRFCEGPEDTDRVTTLTISSDCGHLAVAVLCPGPGSHGHGQSQNSFHAVVSVYEVRLPGSQLMVTMEPLGNKPGHVSAAAFSSDGAARFLCVVSSAPHPALIVLDWKAERVMARWDLDAPAGRVAYALQDTLLFAASGQGMFRTFRLHNANSKAREAVLKMQPAFAGFNENAVTVLDHCWVEPANDGNLLALTSEGQVLVVSTADMCISATLGPAFQDQSGGLSGSPTAIAAFSQGFVVSGTLATVAVWEVVERVVDVEEGANAGPEFQHVQTLRVAGVGETNIVAHSIAVSEESVVVGLGNSEIGTLSTAALFANSDSEEIEATMVAKGFHSGPITGLDVAAQRPLIASVSKRDLTVRIWNYVSRQCELRWRFRDGMPLGVALHPFGFLLVVTFEDKVLVFRILIRELKLLRQVPLKGVKMATFSFGGHLLALAHGKNVLVYSATTLNKVATLVGHQGLVTGMRFEFDDHSLLSCSKDGSIKEWETVTWTKVREKDFDKTTLLGISPAGCGVAYCSAVRGARSFLQRMKQLKTDQELDLPDKMRALSVCHYSSNPSLFSNAMFVGLSTGTVWACCSTASPFKSVPIGLHNGPCNFVRVSLDGRTLISAGEDGVVFVLSVVGAARGEDGKEGGLAGTDSEGRPSGAEVALIERAEIQQCQEDLKQLQQEHNTLKTRLQEEAEKLEEECARKVAEARQKDQSEIQELQRRCSTLEQATEAKERESKRIMKEMEITHTQAAGQLGKLYELKLAHEGDRYFELELAQERLRQQIEEVRQEGERRLLEERERAQEEMERQLAEKDQEIKKHKDLVAYTQHKFNTMLEDEEKEHEVKMAAVQVSAKRELEGQKRIEDQLDRERETLLRGLEMMEVDRARIEKEQTEASIAIHTLRGQTEELSRTVKNLREERKDREATLHDKETKIENYKVKVSNLKKFKHVLDTKLMEVTQSLEPKDHMIGQLNDHLAELETEFERQVKEARASEGKIEQKKQQIAFLAAEQNELQEEVKERDSFIDRYTNDLHDLVTKSDDPRKWAAEIRRMYSAYVCGDGAGKHRLPLEDMTRQMRVMERRVTTLAQKGGQMQATCKADLQRKANENATLLQELNQLRVQRKSLISHIKFLKKKLEEFEDPPDRPSLEDDSHHPQQLDDARPPSASTPEMPRTPSGSLPGPRQTHALQARGGLATRPASTGPGRRGSVPPLPGGGKRAQPQAATQVGRERLNNLNVTVDVQDQELRLQKTENSFLKEQLQKLLKERSGGGVNVGQ